MKNIFKGFLFKIRKDVSVRVTMFIGLGFAIVVPTLMFLIDLGISALGGGSGIEHYMGTGQSLLLLSFSPTSNFGLALPINLVTFTVFEFTNGTIRNKIISGYSKGKVYTGLYLTGLVYTLALILAYVGICFGLGCAYGGFDPEGAVLSITSLGLGFLGEGFIWKYLILCILVYTTIASASVFFASLFRHLGPTIPVVIILLVACNTMASIANVAILMTDGETSSELFFRIMKALGEVLKVINPLHSILTYDTVINETTGMQTMNISTNSFITGIINNLVYSGGFFVGGYFLFKKRDIK